MLYEFIVHSLRLCSAHALICAFALRPCQSAIALEKIACGRTLYPSLQPITWYDKSVICQGALQHKTNHDFNIALMLDLWRLWGVSCSATQPIGLTKIQKRLDTKQIIIRRNNIHHIETVLAGLSHILLWSSSSSTFMQLNILSIFLRMRKPLVLVNASFCFILFCFLVFGFVSFNFSLLCFNSYNALCFVCIELCMNTLVINTSNQSDVLSHFVYELLTCSFWARKPHFDDK